ncbi:MAG TPA: metallophosphoesterase [Pirellulales bacterium]|nr:metallophosphoesterase [Pirellulales bacterium]
MTAPKTLAVVGDLHYESPEDAAYRAARKQILQFQPDVIVQLGDQGGYSHCGTWQSFEEGLDFLRGFDRPFHTLMGNHDVEGRDYASDADAVSAWCEAFGADQPYHEFDLGSALGICLSSTRFRANTGCCHEVHLDDAQIAWLAATLKRNRRRPTFVFSHAPVMGSGLRVLQSIHLKCPNAWLNHTDRPERFVRLVHENPQIKLWFSAHNHLGQNYADSFSRVGSCTFVHTGVIGEVSRDGCHHSRLVEFDAAGFQLSTLDHETGELTANLRHDYATSHSETLSPHTAIDGALHFSPPPFPTDADRLQLGSSVFAVHRGMLVEYDLALRAPLGVVLDDLGDEVPRIRAGELQLLDSRGSTRVLRPNARGRWSQVFEPNPRLARRSA